MLEGNEESWKEFHKSALSFLGELNSEQFYNRLYNLNDYAKYFTNCNALTSFPNGENVKKICARLLKYLETDTFSRNNNNEYDYCLLLNYWVFSSLNVFLQSSKPSYAYQAFGIIENIWNSFIDDKLQNRKNETCKPNSSVIVHTDWRDRKELYEYYVDYYQIKLNLGFYTNRCKDFYEYIESKKKLYEHFKSRCPDTNPNKCPEFYAKCEPYNPENVLPDLSCHQEIINKREADARIAQQRAKALPGSETNSEGTADGMDSVGASNLNGNPHTVTKFGNVLLGVVATSMTSGALYRFTPLGGLIRNGLGWNTNNMRNFNGGDTRLYYYASESFNPYPGEEHYIGYHPA